MKKFILITTIMMITATLIAQPIDSLTACALNPVLTYGSTGNWDSDCVFLPFIFSENDSSFMFYTGTNDFSTQELSIGYAYSDDGSKFYKHLNPIFEPDGTGFDAWAVSQSIVSKTDTGYVMYYNGQPSSTTYGPGRFIGMATANHINGPWTRLEDAVLQAGGGSQWDYKWNTPNSIIEVDSGYFMYFHGMDYFPGGIGQIGLAYSSDGISWEKYDDPATTEPLYALSDPVLHIGEPGSWDDISLWGCGVIKTIYGFEMFYAAQAKTGTAIGYAFSEDGIHWEKDINFPIYYSWNDPYAISSGYTVIEFPSVYLNMVEGLYYVYYDYGPGEGEIGLATAPWLHTSNPETEEPKTLICHLYPNPCNASAHLQFVINERGIAVCDLYNISGRKIMTLMNKELMPGTHEIELDLSHLSNGLYLIRLQAGERVETTKIILHK